MICIWKEKENMSSIKRKLERQQKHKPQRQQKSRFSAKLIVKMCITIICFFLYCLCIYAAFSGEIVYLQQYVGRIGTKDLPGYNWMHLGILATMGYGLLNSSIYDTFNICNWRKAHQNWVFVLDFAIPGSFVILLNIYKDYQGFIGVVSLVVIIFIGFILANFKTIMKKIKTIIVKSNDK